MSNLSIADHSLIDNRLSYYKNKVTDLLKAKKSQQVRDEIARSYVIINQLKNWKK